MDKYLLTIVIVLFVTQVVFAQSLAPATSDDIREFDRQISQSQSRSTEKSLKNDHNKRPLKAPKSSVVSEAARSLGDSDLDQKKQMGQWVSEQKDKEDEKVQSGAASKGQGNANANSSAKDARSSQNVPGQSGSHRKK